MQTSKAIQPKPESLKPDNSKPEDNVYEWLVGGDGDEFTVVCHPATAGPAHGEDIRRTPTPDLVCKLSEIKGQPAK